MGHVTKVLALKVLSLKDTTLSYVKTDDTNENASFLGSGCTHTKVIFFIPKIRLQKTLSRKTAVKKIVASDH